MRRSEGNAFGRLAGERCSYADGLAGTVCLSAGDQSADKELAFERARQAVDKLISN
jgi:hypothetical protein